MFLQKKNGCDVSRLGARRGHHILIPNENGLTSTAQHKMSDEELLESPMIQIWAIYRSGGDRDLGASVAAQMHDVACRCRSLTPPWPGTGSWKRWRRRMCRSADSSYFKLISRCL
jgi:hypothetical protein